MPILIGLGANLGDRRATLRRALAQLEARGIAVIARSSLYETAPVGMASERPFLNAVVAVETERPPAVLLRSLLTIEEELGRERRTGGPDDRPCDLDLLLYDDLCCDEPDLVLPHPRIRQRRFVLIPLLEVDADLRDPVTGDAYCADADRLADDETQPCEQVATPEKW